jgi:predicted enzyme related to lactoylglutathione lyase
MKNTILTALLIVTAFGSGFALHAALNNNQELQAATLKKVTGIGGIFFKCKDPKKVRAWYETNLGLHTNPYGAVFEWHQGADSSKKGFTQWSPFSEKTKYFEPSTKDFMINYRVHDLEALLKELKKNQVIMLDTMLTVPYGKFIHIMDVEGNKLELWEPNDTEYEKMGIEMGSMTTK